MAKDATDPRARTFCQAQETAWVRIAEQLEVNGKYRASRARRDPGRLGWSLKPVRVYCPARDGFSAARIEEEVVVTDKGCRVISLFPAEELPIAARY